MRKLNIIILGIILTFVISACGTENEETEELEDLPTLEVAFDPPETAEVGETVELVAEVTGGSNATSSVGKSRSEEHTSELQSRGHLVCRLLHEKKKK